MHTKYIRTTNNTLEIAAMLVQNIEKVCVSSRIREETKMKNLVYRLLRKEGGFTLVEILIAVAILGIVAAVAVPTVATIKSRSESKANAGELSNVQAATDAMMGDLELESVTVILQLNAINGMAAFPDGTNPLYGGAGGDYMRQANTKCTYYISSGGRVSQDACP